MQTDFHLFTPKFETFVSRHPPLPPAGPDAEAEFDSLALELFALQYRQVPPYRAFCDSLGARPDRVETWSQIPCVPATAFRDFDLTSLPEPTAVFESSGTTAERRSRHYHDADSLRAYETSLLAGFKHRLLNRLPLRASFLSLTPPRSEAPHSSLVFMLYAVSRRFDWQSATFAGRVGRDGSWRLDLDAAVDSLGRADGGPLVITGTAFNFVHFLDALETRGARLRLPPGSRVMETGGYKGRSRALPREELHARIVHQLGIAPDAIAIEYGMTELSSQAYDLPLGETFRESVPDTRIARGDIEPKRLLSPSLSSTRRGGEGARHVRRSLGEGGRAGEEGRFMGRPFVLQFPPWARVRIVSPETGREVREGETGLVQVFDLANIRSVMALQTADLGIRRANGFELAGRAETSEVRGCSLMAREAAA